MPKELNGLRGIVTLVPNDSFLFFSRWCRQNDWAVKETWEGRGPTEQRCDLAQGHSEEEWVCNLTSLLFFFVLLMKWLLRGEERRLRSLNIFRFQIFRHSSIHITWCHHLKQLWCNCWHHQPINKFIHEKKNQ